MSEAHKGRCLCGAVTYEYSDPVNWRGHCHCDSCRRTCSAPMTTVFSVNNDQWRWTGREPAVYVSSPGVERLFCPVCGSPMAYRTERFGHETDFYAASLERPEAFIPDRHFYYSEKLPWLHLSDDLKQV